MQAEASSLFGMGVPNGTPRVGLCPKACGARAGGEELRVMCAEFEAMFIKKMLEASGKSLIEESEGALGAVMDVRAEAARALAKSGCLGIGRVLYEQLTSGGDGYGRETQLRTCSE